MNSLDLDLKIVTGNFLMDLDLDLKFVFFFVFVFLFLTRVTMFILKYFFKSDDYAMYGHCALKRLSVKWSQ